MRRRSQSSGSSDNLEQIVVAILIITIAMALLFG